MFDVILYDVGDETLVECDRELAPKVFKHLKMYKIRKQVQLEKDPEDYQIGHLLGFFSDIESSTEKQAYDYSENGLDLKFWDPRQLRFGKRVLSNDSSNLTCTTLDEYINQRYL